MIEELPNFEKEFDIAVGEIYAVRAFFAISKPINNEVGYQSGYSQTTQVTDNPLPQNWRRQGYAVF